MTKINKWTKRGSFCLMAVVGLLFSNCTKEDLTECSRISVAFRQTINSDNVDKFESEVNKLNLFVFDADGLFVGQYTDAGAHLDSKYRMPLPLAPGKYNLYAWGNADDKYEITPLTAGVSKYTDAKLSVKRGDQNVVSGALTALFNGTAQQITVNGTSNQTIVIDMMKNVNFIRVTVKGLQTQNITTKAQDEFSCRIISPNGDYNFDNSLASDIPLTYIPKYSINSGEVHSDFSTLRLFVGDATRLTVSYKGEQVYSKSLPELLLENPDINNQQDFDRMHEYNIVITLDGNTHIVTSVTVNGWTSNGGGTIL